MTASKHYTRPPVLGFIGIHAGNRKTQPISQNETVASLFSQSGYAVRRASAVKAKTPRTLHQIGSLLVWRDVDVVVIAVFSGLSFVMAEYASFLAKLTGKRVVLFLHGGNLPTFGQARRSRVERVLNRADVVMAPSDFLAETFRSWGHDVHIVPNVLNIDRYEYSPRHAARPNLLWMRTFHEHYDPLMAVRTFAQVAEVHPEATMTMGGADHGLLQATKDEAAALGVADKVSFPGYVQDEVKRAGFADNDIFLNTNVVDNMPVSLLEAAASGLVPVATAVGGIPAIVDSGTNGILVPSGDVDAMAAAILDLIADPDSYSRLSAGARQLAERSGWPQVYERWVEELSLVLPHIVLR